MTTTPTPAPDAAEIEALIARIENDGPFFDCIGEPVNELELDIIAALSGLSRPQACLPVTDEQIVGMVMKATGGSANPKRVREIVALVRATPTPAPDAAEIEALIPKLETLRLHLRDGLDHDADAELVAVAIAALRSLSRPVEVTDVMVERAARAMQIENRPRADSLNEDQRAARESETFQAYLALARAALTAALGGRDDG